MMIGFFKFDLLLSQLTAFMLGTYTPREYIVPESKARLVGTGDRGVT